MSRRHTTVFAFLSAFGAACHETVWPRLLTGIVGHTAWAMGLALTVFLAGLGVGSLLPALRPSVLAYPRRRYVSAELVVAFATATATHGFAHARPPSIALGGSSRVLDALCAGLMLAPAALAMGITYPCLVALEGERPRPATGLYLGGLGGCCAGALLCAGVIVPRWGAVHTGLGAAVLNALLALLAWRTLPEDTGSSQATAQPWAATTWRQPTLSFAMAGIFGVGAQAVWNRVLVPYAGVSSFAFAAIVAVYVAAQALGVALARPLGAVWAARLGAMAPALALGALGLCETVSSWPGPRDGEAWRWALGTLAAVALSMAPAVLALGAAQGSALLAVDGAPDRARAAALVTGLGTLVAAPMALFTAVLLVPAVGPRWALALLAVPLIVTFAFYGRHRLAVVGGLSTVVLAVAAPGPRYFLGQVFDRAPTLYVSHGAQDTTAVVLHDQPVEPAIRRLVSAGVSYSGDSLFAQRYMRLLAHLPALATAGRRRALVLCVGTGTTLDALRLHGFSSLDAVDLDPTIRATLRFFTHVHHGAPDDPRVRLHVDDGARWLAGVPPHTYDVVTLEPPPPRAPGGSSLYTQQLYERARRTLRPGGVLAQWLPLHDLGAWETAALVRTFLDAFPDGALYLAERNEAVLLSVRATRAVAHGPRVDDDLAALGFRGIDPLADTFLADATVLRAASAGAPRVTMAWPGPEFSPLALPRPVEPLSAWVERVVQGATPTAPHTFAGHMASALGAFLRVLEHRPREGDRARVRRSLEALMVERPGDPYLAYMLGFGPYLEERLQRLEREGFDPSVIERTRRRMALMRARAAPE